MIDVAVFNVTKTEVARETRRVLRRVVERPAVAAITDYGDTDAYIVPPSLWRRLTRAGVIATQPWGEGEDEDEDKDEA